MRTFMFILGLTVFLAACTPSPISETPTVTQTASPKLPRPTPLPTDVPPTPTEEIPALHEGYPATTADYTRTNETDAQFDTHWENRYKDYYHQLAEQKLADAQPVTFGWDIPMHHTVMLHSADRKGIQILAAYTTIRTDDSGQQLEEYWRVLAFKTPDGIRVVRAFVGEHPNLSGAGGWDVAAGTQRVVDQINNDGGIRGVMLRFDASETGAPIDVAQVLQDQATAMYQAIRSSNAATWSIEVEDLLLAGSVITS